MTVRTAGQMERSVTASVVVQCRGPVLAFEGVEEARVQRARVSGLEEEWNCEERLRK